MIRFVFPLDGDCLNSRDGKLVGNALCVTVKVEAPEKNDVYICNKKAEYDGEYFSAKVEIENIMPIKSGRVSTKVSKLNISNMA